MADLDDLALRLEAIAEELDELAFDRLRLASADGATTRPVSDKALVQARRAVEKAVRAVRSIDGDVDD